MAGAARGAVDLVALPLQLHHAGMAHHAAHRLEAERRDDGVRRGAGFRGPERHAVRPDRPATECGLRRAALYLLTNRGRLPMTKHRSVLVALAVLLPGAAAVAHGETSPSAKEIMEKVTVTRKLDGSEAVVKMTVTDDKKQSRERDITMATKLYDGGKTEKRIYRFLSPADVQGTSVLVFDYESKADDVWIYLPALRKTRRVVSSQKSQSFMGSEFSYGDLNIPAIDEFDYTMVKQE